MTPFDDVARGDEKTELKQPVLSNGYASRGGLRVNGDSRDGPNRRFDSEDPLSVLGATRRFLN